MKTKKFIAFGAVLALSVICTVVFKAPHTFAATKTWTDGGGDHLFSTSGNWSPSGAPTDGDTLVFPADSGRDYNQNITNDIDNLSLAGINFTDPTSSCDYTTGYFDIVNGGSSTTDALTLTGDIDASAVSDSSCSITLELLTDVTLGANISIESPADGNFYMYFGYYSNADFTLDMSTYNLTANAYTQILSVLDGSGTLTTTNTLVLGNASNIFTGPVFVTGNSTTKAHLYLNYLSAIGEASGITVSDNAQMYLSTANTSGNIGFNTPITLNGDGYTGTGQDGNPYEAAALSVYLYGTGVGQTPSNLTFSHITLGANTTYDSFAAAKSKVTVTTLTANGHSIRRLDGSAGRLIVDGKDIESDYYDQTYDYDSTSVFDYNIYDKTRLILKSTNKFHVIVMDGAIFAGTGTAGDLTVKTGGSVAPGLSPGCLTVEDTTFESGSSFDVELGGTAACTKYDQLKVNGTVDLSDKPDLNISLYNKFKPSKGNSFVIINNNGSDKVTGTFKDLPEGASFSQDGYVYTISYKGGSGNDVVLTVQSVPSTPDTGFAYIQNRPLITLAVSALTAAGTIMLAKVYNRRMSTRIR